MEKKGYKRICLILTAILCCGLLTACQGKSEQGEEPRLAADTQQDYSSLQEETEELRLSGSHAHAAAGE